jgi:DNA invertase Pin-like site-specific DNA recombinase
MKIGYRRVSSDDQSLERQELPGIDKVFEEKLSGKTAADRPALQSMIEFARDGDEVVSHSIDRLARNLADLQSIIQTLNDKGVSVTFLSEGLSFSASQENPFARLQLQIMGSFAEFERSLIRQRQASGIAKARSQGLYMGRKATIDPEAILSLHGAGLGATAIAERLGISRASVYRLLPKSLATENK